MGFLTKMDYFMYLKIRHWSKRVSGTSGKGYSYFHSVGNDKWIFSIPQGPALLRYFKFATASSRIVKVRGQESPYSGNEKYWSKRLSVKPSISTRVKILFSKQKGICADTVRLPLANVGKSTEDRLLKLYSVLNI